MRWLLGACFLFPAFNLFAADATLETLKKQQEQLEKTLSELEKSQQEKGQQQQRLEMLSRQIQCNWAFIKNRESCDLIHKDNIQEKLVCHQKAKETAAQCLNSPSNKP